MITFGPVPSRRLGRSLGVNNIPYKVCSYSCVYCQVGRTKHFQVEPTPFYEPEAIAQQVRKRTARLRNMGEAVGYLTFVPDGDGNLNSTAAFLRRLHPDVAYLSIPTRPPAESWVLPPCEETVARAHRILSREVTRVEHLIGYEGNAFSATGKAEDDLLAITAVHPMRDEAVSELLEKAQADWTVVQGMIDRGLLVETAYEGRKYFLRKFPKPRRRV